MRRRSVLAAALIGLSCASITYAAEQEPRLVDAIRRGDVAAQRALIKQRVGIMERDVTGQTPLHLAVERGDFALAKALIEAGASTTATSRYGVTPLHLACVNGDAQTIELLLKTGGNANETWAYGETILMVAARTGVPEALRVLLAHGATVNAKTEQGQTALMWAAAANNAAAIRVLVEAGADIKARTEFGFTPLFFAVREGQMDAVRALVAAGADINDRLNPLPSRRPKITREQGAAVAAIASMNGGLASYSETEALGHRALIRQSYHAPDDDSVVAVAILNGRYDIARYLVEQGADPNAQDARGSLLHALAFMRRPGNHQPGAGLDLAPPPDGDSLALAKTLLTNGANPNVGIKWEEWPFDIGSFMTRNPTNIHVGRTYLSYIGATPYYLAAQRGDVALMKVLLAAGANPTTPTIQNVTPLMAAAGLGYQDGESPGPRVVVGTTSEKEAFDAVKLAWEQAPDSVNVTTDYGELPPFTLSGVEMLFQVVPNMNKTGKALGDLRWAGSTALHGAALRGQLDIIQFLVDKGARLDIKNKIGWLPVVATNTMMLGNTAKAERVQSRALLIKLMRERGLEVPDEAMRDLIPNSEATPNAASAAVTSAK